jgi:hypothetical protein
MATAASTDFVWETRHSMTINILPDNVLLEIFVFYRSDHRPSSYGYPYLTAWQWLSLVHVCLRWRQIIFASPHRLDLQIFCAHGNPVRKNLGIWPPFPITVDYCFPYWGMTHNDEDNLIAALEHPDRVRYFGLDITGSQLGKMVTLMQVPFPILTHLKILSGRGYVSVFPTEFLGGSAPCLQNIRLNGIPFPTLPRLLLSAGDLVTLELLEIPLNGYIPSEAMVASLAVLPRLAYLIIGFESATHRPNLTHPPPITRPFLPALTSFEFRGASKYLEDLVAPIDAPQLNRIRVRFLDDSLDFRIPQLSMLFDRSAGPPYTLAAVRFSFYTVTFDMYRHTNYLGWEQEPASTHFLCEFEGSDWQLPLIAQVLSNVSPMLSTVVHLKLDVILIRGQLEGAGDVEWLHFLNQLSTVQALHVSRQFAEHLAFALKNITGEMVAKALSSLEFICLEDRPTSSVEKFIAARRVSGRPVTVLRTATEFDQRLMSYVSK